MKVAHGRRGSITRVGNIATKTAHTYHTKGAVIKEALIIQKLNDASIKRVPQITQVHEDGFSYLWIEGTHFDKVFNTASKRIQYDLARQLLHHAFELDKLGVIHGELHRPTGNVLVNHAHEVSLIDFERGTLQDFSGKNMKAVGQWMRREGWTDITTLQGLKGLSIDEIYKYLSDDIPNNSGSIAHRSMFGLIATILVLLGIDLSSKFIFYSQKILSTSAWITPIRNLGSAWSLPVPQLLTLVVAGGVIWYLISQYRKSVFPLLPTALIIAGALGNSYDRVIYGGVRDFIDINQILSYPIFNGADIFLVCGVVILLGYQMMGTSPDTH